MVLFSASIHLVSIHAIFPLLTGSKGHDSQLEEERNAISARQRQVLFFYFFFSSEDTKVCLIIFFPLPTPLWVVQKIVVVIFLQVSAQLFLLIPLFPTCFREAVFLMLLTADFPSQRNNMDMMNNLCVKCPIWRWSKDINYKIACDVMWEYHSYCYSIGCTDKNTAIWLIIDRFFRRL